MSRNIHTLFLEILPVAPLSHGQGANGNEQEILRRPFRVPIRDADGRVVQYVVEEIPAVSGASFRSKLRTCALQNAARLLGIDDGSLSKDVLRLLQKGGHLGGDSKGVNLEETRRITNMFPMLTLFGTMDNRLSLTGKLKVSDVIPYCQEVIDAGVLPLLPGGWWRGDDTGADWPCYAHAPAPSMVDSQRSVTYYRHDLGSSPNLSLMCASDRLLTDSKREAVTAAKAAGERQEKEDRRAATESMPHGFQTIIAGTPMICVLRTDPITDVEYACLIHALATWRDTGARLGGAESKGHGQCKVRIAGSLRISASTEMVNQNALARPDIADQYQAIAEAYERQQRDIAEAARAWLAQ